MFENFKVFETELAGRPLVVETGKMAQLANGECLVRYGDTVVHVAATASAKPRDGIDFFPLSVDFEEKLYSVGKIPGSFLKREGRPSEKATLTCRMIDRPIRPLFPKDMRNDVSIVCTVMSVEQDNSPEIAALIGTSIALSISDIPWNGPISGVSVGLVDGEFVINPTAAQRKVSQMAVTVASTSERIAMIEAGANEVSDEDMYNGILAGHEANQKIIAFIKEIQQEIGKAKFRVSLQQARARAVPGHPGFCPGRSPGSPGHRRQERPGRASEARVRGGTRKVRSPLSRAGRENRRVPVPDPEVCGAPLAPGRAEARRRPRHGRDASSGCRSRPAAPGPWFRHVHPWPDPGAHRGTLGSIRDAQLLDGIDEETKSGISITTTSPPTPWERPSPPAAPAAGKSATALWRSGPWCR